MKIISAEAAAALFGDGSTIIPGGFGCAGHPEAITKAIERRFVETGHPRGLKLYFAAGPGDRQDQGLNRLAKDGLVSEATGGFWGFAPKLAKMALTGQIVAYTWPQGVISQSFREIARGQHHILSRVGLGTFVDLEGQGGAMNSISPSLVSKIRLHGEDFLAYQTPSKIDVLYLRATSCDASGNLSFEEEVSYQDAISQSIATKNTGGIVIAQVKFYSEHQPLDPLTVKVPGNLVDFVVVANDLSDHKQTYAEPLNLQYVQASHSPLNGLGDDATCDLARTIVIEKVAKRMALHSGTANLGIGIPSEIAKHLSRATRTLLTLSVEGGAMGGDPASGLSFGASQSPQAILDQNQMFDLYDGGGLDLGVLGFGQVDGAGCMNICKIGDRFNGIGGFMNIAQNAKKLLFCGTFSSGGLRVERNGDALKILQEGRHQKFVEAVSHVCFNPKTAATTQSIELITERASFIISRRGLTMTDMEPGMDFESQIQRLIPFKVERLGQ